MLQKGDIIWHKSFSFHDGGTPQDKFLILLNTPQKGEPFLFVLTTSQPKNKPQTQGCYPDAGYFVIDEKKEKTLPKRTWIKLYDIYEFDYVSLLKSSLQLKEIVNKEPLKEQTINEIINCIKRCKDIQKNHKLLILGR